jgi:hypothetical protein
MDGSTCTLLSAGWELYQILGESKGKYWLISELDNWLIEICQDELLVLPDASRVGNRQ